MSAHKEPFKNLINRGPMDMRDYIVSFRRAHNRVNVQLGKHYEQPSKTNVKESEEQKDLHLEPIFTIKPNEKKKVIDEIADEQSGEEDEISDILKT
ncbi:hypothetical protein BLA29_014609, partial [Euroglyphus maynei]